MTLLGHDISGSPPYTRENPHIHELMLKHGGSWHHTDLTRLTDAPELV